MLVDVPYGAARLGGASEPTGSCGEVPVRRQPAEPEIPRGEEAPPIRPASPGPLPEAEQLLPAPYDPHLDGAARLRVVWPVADVLELPFTAAAAAGYAAYRARRIASLLLSMDSMVLQGYASQLEVFADDLDHAFETTPVWAGPLPVWGMAL